MRGREAPRRYCRRRAPTSPRARPQIVVGSDLQPPRREPRADSRAQRNAAAALLQLPVPLSLEPCPTHLGCRRTAARDSDCDSPSGPAWGFSVFGVTIIRKFPR